MSDKDDSTRTVTGTFQCQMQVTQQRTITMTGHVYSDDTPDEINARIDLYQDSMDRQFIRCDIVNKEAQKVAILQGVAQFREQLADLASRQEGRTVGLSAGEPTIRKLSTQEREALKKGDQNIANMVSRVNQLDLEIAAAKRKIGMTPA